MIFEERDYHIRPGKLGLFVAAYRDFGLEIQKKYLGTFISYFTTEVGELNHVVALWGYEGLDDRMARRKKMLADPEWQEYLKRVDGMIERQNTRILTPVDFSPLQ